MQQKTDLMSGLRYSISQEEINRRHELVRAYMKKQELGAILILSTYKGGYRRWFTGEEGSERRSESYLFIPMEGDVIHIVGDNFVQEDRTAGQRVGSMPDPEGAFAGIRTQYYFSAFEIRRMLQNSTRLGVIHMEDMRLSMHEYLAEYLKDVTIQNLGADLEKMIAEKSMEEIGLMQKVISLQEKVFEGICAYIKPGLLEADIVRFGRYLANHLECGGIDSIESAQIELLSWNGWQENTPLPFPGRTLQDGDTIQVKLRIMGDSGYFGSFTRLLSIGKPRQKEINNWVDMVSVQKFIQKKLISGKTIAIVKDEIERELKEYKLKFENEDYIHGIGYSPIEYPVFSQKDQELVLKEGMTVVVEPQMRFGKNVYCCGDQYLITKNGAVRMTTISHEIKIV